MKNLDICVECGRPFNNRRKRQTCPACKRAARMARSPAAARGRSEAVVQVLVALPPSPRMTAKEQRAEEIRLGREAFDLAKQMNPDPGFCAVCGDSEGLRHAHHHRTRFADMVKQGTHTDPNAHEFIWICEDCHIEAHAGESAVNLLISAKRKRIHA